MKKYLFGVMYVVAIIFGCSGTSMAAVPTITPGTMAAICAGNYTTLSYSSTNMPTHYSITWAGSPVGIPNVPAGTVLPFTAIPVNTLATAATGTYSGTITVSNSDGSSAPMPISITVNGLPGIFPVFGGGGFCYGGVGVHVGLTSTEAGVLYQLYRGGTPVGTSVWGTGASIDFGLQTVAGYYTVVGTNASTLCERGMSGGAIVTVYTTPTVVSVTGGGGYCDGGTGVPVGLSGSIFGINYQLYRGGIPVGSPVPGIGMALDFGPQTIAGTYTATAIDTLSPFCPVNMSGSATVISYPLPTQYSVTGGGDYCDGGYGVHVGLSNSNTGVSYKMYRGTTLIGTVAGTGAPLDFGLITGLGVYRVKATNTVYGCMSDMLDSANIGLIPVVVPTVAINSSIGTTICKGQADTFTAVVTNEGTGPTYVWNVNGAYAGVGPTYSYVPTHNDYIEVTLTSDAECAVPYIVNEGFNIVVKDKIVPTVVINALPSTSIINGTSVTLTAIVVNGGVTPTFQWYVNGVLVAGATGNTFTSTAFTDMDTVSCHVMGCADTAGKGSAVMHVIPRAGINQVNATNGSISIIPNPSNGVFTVRGELATSVQQVAVKITDVVGKTVYTGTAQVANGLINDKIELPAAAGKGMYMLSLRAESVNITAKLLVE